MDLDDELDAALIDAFDAPDEAQVHDHTSAKSLGASVCGAQQMARCHGVTGARDTTVVPRYPSLDDHTTPSGDSRVVRAVPRIVYPAFGSESMAAASAPQTRRFEEHVESTVGHDHTTTVNANAVIHERALPQDLRVPTDEEIEEQRQRLQAQLSAFQEKADYVALALAGETPHQVEARKRREEERRLREERRVVAMETRLEQMIEREHEREARQRERRSRHVERSHRSSLSPTAHHLSDSDPSRGTITRSDSSTILH